MHPYMTPEQHHHLSAVADLEAPTKPPYGTLDVPPYQAMKSGRWYLHPDQTHRVVRGQFTGIQSVDDNWILKRKERGRETIWMSVTPMERESLALQAEIATGTVVIMGLGMGLLLWNVSRKPEVKEIIVVEQDRSIIALFDHLSAFWDWPERSKVLIMEDDALSWKPVFLQRQVDALLIDIWPLIGDTRLRPETMRIQQNVGAKRVAAWGQELDFITYCQETERPFPLTDAYMAAYVEETGVPFAGADDPDYPSYCATAVMQTLLTIR